MMLRISQLPLLSPAGEGTQLQHAERVRILFYTQMCQAHTRLLCAVAQKQPGATPAYYQRFGNAMQITMTLHTETAWWDRHPKKVGYDLSRIWQAIMKTGTMQIEGISYQTFIPAFHDIATIIQDLTGEVQYLGISCSACYHPFTIPVDRYVPGVLPYCLECTPTRYLPSTEPIVKVAQVSR